MGRCYGGHENPFALGGGDKPVVEIRFNLCSKFDIVHLMGTTPVNYGKYKAGPNVSASHTGSCTACIERLAGAFPSCPPNFIPG